jgi:esterase
MSVKLHTAVKGAGPDVVLLHGLFGAGNNLGALARSLADRYTVHSIDLPNHGRSGWIVPADLTVMADCVSHWVDGQGLAPVSVVGHSLGGKVAMELALSRPELIRSLVVADIAPVAYPPSHEAVFAALSAVVATPCASRQEAADRMAAHLAEGEVIQFLLGSLYRAADHGYRWRFNLEGLRSDYHALRAAPAATGPYPGPVLFVKGGESAYLQSSHRERINALFPLSSLKVIAGCGHWLHVEKPQLFNRLVSRFLDSQAS